MSAGEGKSASRFRDIDVNILPDRYRPRRLPVRYVFLSLVALIAVSGLFPGYQIKTWSGTETAHLQSELDRVTRTLSQVRLQIARQQELEDAVEKMEAEAETLKQEHQAILNRDRGFAGILELVTDDLPPVASLISISLASDKIDLKGESDSPMVVIDYAKALGQEGIFTEVFIAKIEEDTFDIVLKR